jgi:cytochrome c biogenesis protein ResB
MTDSRLGSWLRRQTGRLASGRLTAWLLAILVSVLCVHLFLPQQDQVHPKALEHWVEQKGLVGQLCRALGLTRILHTGLFWAPYVLLTLNLIVCMIRRLRGTLGLFGFPERPPRVSLAWLHREVTAAGLGEEEVAELLGKQGYRTLVFDGGVYALRGRFAIAGHWLFHLGLLALLISGFFIVAAPVPFRGMVGVGEGEPFDLHAVRILSSNQPVGPELPELKFRMEQIDVVTEGSEVRRYEARMIANDGERTSIGINRPYREAPYQVMVHGFGYMAGWVIVNERGRMVNGAWVKLVPFPLERSDTFSLGAEESSVHARLYPDHERQGEKDRSRSYELRNPRFMARVVWRGEKAYNGLLAPEQRVPLQDGLEFFFLPEIRRYSLLEVIQEKGHATVFACLGVMILGLAVRYVRIRREILVQRAGGALQVFGRGEIFENLFAEEFGRLTEALASATPRPEPRPEDRRGAK